MTDDGIYIPQADEPAPQEYVYEYETPSDVLNSRPPSLSMTAYLMDPICVECGVRVAKTDVHSYWHRAERNNWR